MTTLSDIRERDAGMPAKCFRESTYADPPSATTVRDRRYLLKLLDAYQAREREARELLAEAGEYYHSQYCGGGTKYPGFENRRDAWLDAPPVEGEGE